MMRKFGISVVAAGIIMTLRTRLNSASFPLKLMQAKAKAARDDVTREINVAATATKSVLPKYRSHGAAFHASM